MSAHDEREAIYRDLAAGRLAGDALRERVAALARVMGVSAAVVLLDLYVEVRGLDYPQVRRSAPGAGLQVEWSATPTTINSLRCDLAAWRAS